MHPALSPLESRAYMPWHSKCSLLPSCPCKSFERCIRKQSDASKVHPVGAACLYTTSFSDVFCHVSIISLSSRLEHIPSNTECWGGHSVFHWIKTSLLVEKINTIKKYIFFLSHSLLWVAGLRATMKATSALLQLTM